MNCFFRGGAQVYGFAVISITNFQEFNILDSTFKLFSRRTDVGYVHIPNHCQWKGLGYGHMAMLRFGTDGATQPCWPLMAVRDCRNQWRSRAAIGGLHGGVASNAAQPCVRTLSAFRCHSAEMIILPLPSAKLSFSV